MKKILKSSVIISVLLLMTVVYANGNMLYEIYETGVKIIYNEMGMNYNIEKAEKEVDFNLPVLNINGNTYVPLREVAEKSGLKVSWDGEKNTITLTANYPDIDVYKTFEEIFSFSLPKSAKLLNFDYGFEYEEHSLAAKFIFNEADLKQLITNIETLPLYQVTAENAIESDLSAYRYFHKYYSWWEVSGLDDDVIAYRGMHTGNRKKSVRYNFVIQKTDNTEYLLYVAYY